VAAAAGRQADQQRGNIPDRQAMIDPHVPQRILRHGRRLRLLRVLDDGDASGRFDRREPRRTVVEPAREDHPRDARSEMERGGAE